MTTVTVLGGDLRQYAVIRALLRAGKQVFVCGLPRDKCPPEATWQAQWRAAVANADAVILPIPSAHDGRRVATPLLPEAEPIELQELFGALKKGCFLAVGKMEGEAIRAASKAGAQVYDYFESETLQQKNAVPTAEGAVLIVMRELPRTVAEMPVAITGFGRIARALASLLAAMGARVTVAARKEKDLQAARRLGYGTVSLSESGAVSALGQGYAAVFNTVPACLFNEECLRAFDRTTLLIDLASAPGGVDAEAAARLGIRVIFALSLPGKYAPETAGEIIAETVLEEMKRREGE